ncbi:hypothetical protein [Gracilinema caldarium]|uniref:hypothetical protein n=1 Tax=Gracilinema caldarium TaxID=215591 RepID=UPI0026EC53FA|nr:hypothetical protein [Gracilinema caldarium]
MKRCSVIIAMLLLLSLPAFAQLRIDLGIEIPRGAGSVSGNEVFSDPEVNKFLTDYIFPIPEIDLYYQFDFGSLRAGLGLRMYTFLIASIFWPNAFIEADIWNLTAVAQMGGGFFGMYALGQTRFENGKVFMPDLSLWYRFGNSFRLGGGAIGFMLPESTNIGFLYYIGGKFNIVFK